MGLDRLSPEAFDFSRDAQAFKARLWNRLKAGAVKHAPMELEDDMLGYVNAAGVPSCDRAQDDKRAE